MRRKGENIFLFLDCLGDYLLFPNSNHGTDETCISRDRVGDAVVPRVGDYSLITPLLQSNYLKLITLDRYCGSFLNCITGQAFSRSVFTDSFMVSVNFNAMDNFAGGVTNNNRGFCLNWQQIPR